LDLLALSTTPCHAEEYTFNDGYGIGSKKDDGSGMRAWHSPWWVGAEVSLPRLLATHNSSMDYDHVAALGKLKQLIDDDIELNEWQSPS